MKTAFTLPLGHGQRHIVVVVIWITETNHTSDTTEAKSGITALSSNRSRSSAQCGNTSANGDVTCSASASGALSDTVMLQLIARRRQTATASTEHHQPARAVVARRQSATDTMTATTPRYDRRKTATDNNRLGPAANHHKLRRTRSSTHDYRDISAAIAASQFPAAKYFQPTPSPVDFDVSIPVPATEEDQVESGRTDSVQRTCLDDVTSRSSHNRLSVTTNEMPKQAPVKPRISKPEIIADMGFTPRQFTWLREVNRCLNPHRCHHWSD